MADLSQGVSQQGFVVTQVDNVLNWARTGSLWPMTFGLVAMLVFLGILVVGFVYEWKKGALEWE